MASSVFQVVPLRRLPSQFEVLDYDFPATTPPPEIGEIVDIPFGQKMLEGIVWAFGASAKGHGAKRKKLQRQIVPRYITPEQVALLQWLGQETLTPLSTIALSMVATVSRVHAGRAQDQVHNGILIPHLTQREKILQQFAKRASQKGRTLVFVPALPYAQSWKNIFGPRCAIVHGKLTDRQKTKLLASDADVLVTTAVGIYLPHVHIRHIILDVADDDGYLAFDQAPRLDIRRAVAVLSRAHAAPLTLLARWQSPTLLGVFPSTVWRGRQPANWTIISRAGEAGEARRLPVASGIVERVQSGKTLWLVRRRSEAGHLRCQDCGSAILCPNCSRILQVQRENSRQILYCSTDRTRSLIPDTCLRCNSVRLSTQGKGVEVIADEIAMQLNQKVSVLDAGKKLEGIVQKNIVATSAIANYPQCIFDRAVVVRAESFLGTGNYRATEEFHGVLALTRQHVRPEGKVFLQTFQPDNPDFIAGTSLTSREQRERTTLHYPPFGTLVVLQPRRRVARVSEKPFSTETQTRLQAVVHGTQRWMIRCGQAQRHVTLSTIRENIDPSWEAIVDPPRITAD